MRGPVPACATRVAEGMEVTTVEPGARRAPEEHPGPHPVRAPERLPHLLGEGILRRPQGDHPEGRRGHGLRPLREQRPLSPPGCGPRHRTRGPGISGRPQGPGDPAGRSVLRQGRRALHPLRPLCPGLPRGPGRVRHRLRFAGAGVRHRDALRQDPPRFGLSILRRLRRCLSDGGAPGEGGPAGGASRPARPGRLPPLPGRLRARARDPGRPGPRFRSFGRLARKPRPGLRPGPVRRPDGRPRSRAGPRADGSGAEEDSEPLHGKRPSTRRRRGSSPIKETRSPFWRPPVPPSKTSISFIDSRGRVWERGSSLRSPDHPSSRSSGTWRSDGGSNFRRISK